MIQILQGANVDPSRYFGLLYPVAEEDRKPLRELRVMFEQFQQESPAAPAEQPPKVDTEELHRLVQEHVDRALEAKQPKRRRG